MPADSYKNRNQQQFLTVQQAADILNVSGKTLRRWDKSGKLIARRTRGGQRRYREDKILEFSGQYMRKKPGFVQPKVPVVSHLPLPPSTQISKKSSDFSFFHFAGALAFSSAIILFFYISGVDGLRKIGNKITSLRYKEIPMVNVLGEEEERDMRNVVDMGSLEEFIPLFATSAQSAYISPINTIANSSFEGGDFGASPRHWGYFSQSSVGNTTVTNEAVRTGNLALKMEDKSVINSPADELTGQLVVVDFGISQPKTSTSKYSSYTLSLYIKTTDLKGNPTLRLGFMGGSSIDGDEYIDYQLSSYLTTDWQRYDFTYNQQETGKYPYIQVLNYQGGKIFVDDISLNEVASSQIPVASNQMQDTRYQLINSPQECF